MRYTVSCRSLTRVLPLSFALGLAAVSVCEAQIMSLGGYDRAPPAAQCDTVKEKRFWTLIADENALRAKLRGSAAVEFRGNEADDGEDDDNLYRLGTRVGISRGTYPSEFRFDAAVSIQLESGVFREDVTTFRMNYDYYVKNWLEVYGFAERFSNSFLDIDQRYEVGAGAFLGFNIGLTANGRGMRDTLLIPVETVKTAEDSSRLSCYRKARGAQTLPESDSVALERLKTISNNARLPIGSRYKRLRIGVALSALAELEQATIKTRQLPDTLMGQPIDSDTGQVKLSLPGRQKFRLSIRPTVVYRPSDAFTINLFPYFKLPLSAPRKTKVPGGKDRLDYRMDLESWLEFTVSQAERAGAREVKLILRYTNRFDNAPPRATADQIMGRTLLREVGRERHQYVSLELSIGF